MTQVSRSGIVGFWADVFKCLKCISIFHWAYRLLKGRFIDRKQRVNSPWINCYVRVQLVIAALIFALMPQLTEIPYHEHRSPFWWLVVFLAIYGGVRVFELTVYIIDVVLFEPHRDEKANQGYKIDSAIRSIILLFYNFVEVILWFATLYLAFPEHFRPTNSQLFANGMLANSVGALYSSFTITTNIGQAGIQPETDCGAMILWAQSVVGLVVILIGLARFLSILPTPERNTSPPSEENND